LPTAADKDGFFHVSGGTDLISAGSLLEIFNKIRQLNYESGFRIKLRESVIEVKFWVFLTWVFAQIGG